MTRKATNIANMATMMNRLLSALLLVCSVVNAGDLPDPRITPGATSHEVTQKNVQSTA
jgi:hypothetical protein